MNLITIKQRYFLLVAAGLVYAVTAAIVSSYRIVWLYVPYFDKLLHIGGGVIAAMFVASILDQKSGKSGKLKRLAVILVLVLVIGVVWEIAENLSSIYGPTYWPILGEYFYGGDLADTFGDLGSDLLGAFLYFLVTLL